MVSKKHIDKLRSSKKTKMFLFFLTLSFLFWMLIKLSKQYTDDIQLHVLYENVPEGKMLTGSIREDVNITVQAYGFELIKYHMIKRKIAIDLASLKKNKKGLYFKLGADLLPEVDHQIASEIEVLKVKPDTLFFELGVSKSKEVAIVPDVQISYTPGFNISGALEVSPSAVTIEGPDRLIDSITYVSTKLLELNNVNSAIDKEVDLVQLEKSSKVVYSISKVRLQGKVEKFTETRISLPIRVINLPSNLEITTFPGEVELIFSIGLSDYSKIDTKDFNVICDYKKSIENNLNYLIPELIHKPSVVSDVKIVPAKIDYLIKE